MATWQDYFYGRKRAKIKPEQIKAPSMQKNKKMVAKVMQGAFNFYYYSHKAINKIQSGDKLNIRQATNLRVAMRSDLQSAADAWFYNDLKWCFQHLAANNGEWKDDCWDGYEGKCNIPRGIGHFYKEIKKRRNDASHHLGKISSYRKWRSYQQKLNGMKQMEKWEKMGKEIGYTEKALKEVTPFVWAVVGGCEKVGSMAKLMGQWVGYGAKVHNYMTLYAKIKDSQHVKETLYLEAAAAVVNTVPIFGSLYADVIRGIPNLVKFFEKHARATRRAIDRV